MIEPGQMVCATSLLGLGWIHTMEYPDWVRLLHCLVPAGHTVAGSPWGPAEPEGPTGPAGGLSHPTVLVDPDGPWGPVFINTLAKDAVDTEIVGLALLAVTADCANEELGPDIGWLNG